MSYLWSIPYISYILLFLLSWERELIEAEIIQDKWKVKEKCGMCLLFIGHINFSSEIKILIFCWVNKQCWFSSITRLFLECQVLNTNIICWRGWCVKASSFSLKTAPQASCDTKPIDVYIQLHKARQQTQLFGFFHTVA